MATKILQNNWHPATLVRRLWLHFCNDSQFRNSVYIMLSTGVMSALGFLFWIVASRLYTPSEIGLATPIISVASLLTAFSLFGLSNVIIRFLPTSDNKNRLISTILFIVSLGSIAVSSLFLLWAYLTNNPVIQLGALSVVAPIFIMFVFLQTTGIIFDNIFIAHRNTKYILFKNSLFGVIKLILPFAFIVLGSIGIIYSITIATLVAWFAGLLWVTITIGHRPTPPSTQAIKGTMRFATGNYLGNIFSMLPASLLPLIVVSRLGAQEAAYFYMPMMIIALINVIPSANAQSLFAEASNNEEELPNHLQKAFRHLFLLLIPAVVTILVSAHFILSFFGTEYAETGTRVLQILAISSLIGSLNYFGDTLLNIKKLSGLYIKMNAVSALSIIIPVYFVAPYGLTAIALAWFVGQVVTLLIYLLINHKLILEVYRSTKKDKNA